MGKNWKGGNKGKKCAKRHYNHTDRSNKIRLKQDDDEHYAKITTMYGNAADILCDDGITRLLVWRKKFKGRNKRDNNIHMNGVVLVGVRDWEVVNLNKKKKADLLFVYSMDHVIQLYKKKDIPRRVFPDDIASSAGIRENETEPVDTIENVIVNTQEKWEITEISVDDI